MGAWLNLGHQAADGGYDWNVTPERPRRASDRPIEFRDETLRDGLQSSSATDPSMDEKIGILHLMEAIGVHDVNIGLPGSGVKAKASAVRLAREIARAKMSMTASCAARTHTDDILAVADVVQHTGIAITADLFIGSSPIRQYVEEWDVDWMTRQAGDAVSLAVREGLQVMFVTEDTTRSRPEAIRRLYAAAIDNGASRVCICDTVGHATPAGVQNLVRFIRAVVEAKNPAVRIDWHGHSDRGLAEANTIAALEAGVDRVHGCALGIGERVGNAALDLLILNLHAMGWIRADLAALPEYVRLVSRATKIAVPPDYPLFRHVPPPPSSGNGLHRSSAPRPGLQMLLPETSR